MLSTPRHQEIDPRTLKLIVGVIAISLPILTSQFASVALQSISESYYEDGWSRSIFIGFLFAIASFLLAYNGLTKNEMILSKIAAVAGLGVALFPCDCGHDPEVVPFVHGSSAAVMFVVLAYFCLAFYQRAKVKHYPQAKVRAAIYVACGLVIVLSILVLAVDYFAGRSLSARIVRLTFYGEAAALVAFGIAWFTASKCAPGLAHPDERFSLLRDDNPPA